MVEDLQRTVDRVFTRRLEHGERSLAEERFLRAVLAEHERLSDRHCAARRRDGDTCRAWAVKGSDLCGPHAHPPALVRIRRERVRRDRCAARRLDGEQCRGESTRESEMCGLHQGQPGRCAARRLDGEQCHNRPLADSERCLTHDLPEVDRGFYVDLPGGRVTSLRSALRSSDPAVRRHAEMYWASLHSDG